MAQHDYVIANGTGAAVRSDLNNALAAIVSNNSGATEPATMYAYQWWADTTTGLLKLRNGANNAWITLRELDGTLTIEAGTVSAPGLAFASDLNTGVWSPGADQFAIATNGVERVEWGTSEVVFNDGGANYDFRIEGDTNANLLFVDASADAVGIGTSSPGAQLHVKTTATAGGNLAYFDDSGSGVVGRFQVLTTGGTSADGIRLAAVNRKTIELGASTGSPVLAVDATNSRVGIGTTSPNSNGLLTVAGNIVFPSASQGLVDDAGNAIIQRITSGNIDIGNGNWNNLRFYTGSSERARIDSSGRLLVGTSTARANLYNSTISSNLQVEGTDYSTSSASLTCNSASANIFSTLNFCRSAGSTVGSNTLTPQSYYLGQISFQGSDGTEFVSGAEISALVDGVSGANDLPTRLVFSTTADGASSPTERMRINQAGQLLIGKTSGDDTVTGVKLGVNDGDNVFTVGSGAAWALMCNRQSDDGTLITFRQANTAEGTISVSGNTVSYNQFLGSHWAALIDWSRPEIKLGTIIETINELTDWKYATIEVDGEQKKICYNGTAAPGDTVSVEYEGETYEGIVDLETNPEFNKAVKVKVNDTAASKAVYGVFVGWNTDSGFDGGIWNDMYVGAVGNYVIRMAAGQEPEIGDLVVADGTGCAVVQDDDIIRTKTVAKITSTIPQVTYDDGSFLVTCVLYCG